MQKMSTANIDLSLFTRVHHTIVCWQPPHAAADFTLFGRNFNFGNGTKNAAIYCAIGSGITSKLPCQKIDPVPECLVCTAVSHKRPARTGLDNSQTARDCGWTCVADGTSKSCALSKDDAGTTPKEGG